MEPTNEEGNIVAAIDQGVGSVVHRANTGTTEGAPADKQILIRVTELDRQRWKAAASDLGMTLSDFIRDTINEKVRNTLECSHPAHFRKKYPWSESCLKCGARIK